MKTLKKIDPMSAAKMAAVLGAIFGLVAAVATLIVPSLEDSMGRFYANYQAYLPLGGILNIVILPIAYGITMFIAAFIGSYVYNFIAGKIGGVKVDLA